MIKVIGILGGIYLTMNGHPFVGVLLICAVL
jgi:hypothetical protein